MSDKKNNTYRVLSLLIAFVALIVAVISVFVSCRAFNYTVERDNPNILAQYSDIIRVSGDTITYFRIPANHLFIEMPHNIILTNTSNVPIAITRTMLLGVLDFSDMDSFNPTPSLIMPANRNVYFLGFHDEQHEPLNLPINIAPGTSILLNAIFAVDVPLCAEIIDMMFVNFAYNETDLSYSFDRIELSAFLDNFGYDIFGNEIFDPDTDIIEGRSSLVIDPVTGEVFHLINQAFTINLLNHNLILYEFNLNIILR